MKNPSKSKIWKHLETIQIRTFKRFLIALLLGSLAVGVVNSVPNAIIDVPELLKPQKEPAQENLSNVPQEIIEEPIEWIQDASVNITYSFSEHYILQETFNVRMQGTGDSIYIQGGASYGFAATYENDAYIYAILLTDDDANDDGELYIDFQITALTSGTLSYDISFAYDEITREINTGTYAIGTEHIDADGRLTFVLTNDRCRYYFMRVWDTEETTWDTIFAEDEGSDPPAWGDIRIYIDEIAFQQDPIISYLRSEYRKTDSSDVLEWKLEIPNHEYKTTITLELPDYIDTNNLEINPSCSYSVSGNTLTLSDTIPTKSYEIRSTYKNYKRYIANLKDVSADYLDNIGFEGAWEDDFISSSVESVDLNSSIVHSGAYSLRLHDSDSASDSPYIRNDNSLLKDGYYYVAFAYFVEAYSNDGGTADLRFYWYDGSWTYESLAVTTNTWIQIFKYIHVDGNSGYGNLQLYSYRSDFTIFFDSLQIYQVAATIQASAYQELTLSGSLDNLVRPDKKIPVPYEPINIDLRDRTADSSIASGNLFTDSLGYWKTTYSGNLAQREYEVQFSHPEDLWNDFIYFEAKYGIDGLSFEQGTDEEVVILWAKHTQSSVSYLGVNALKIDIDGVQPVPAGIRISSHTTNWRLGDYYWLYNDYPYVTYRIASDKNVEVQLKFKTETYPGGNYVVNTSLTGGADYTIVTYDVRDYANGAENITDFLFHFRDDSGDFEGDENIYFDYIRLMKEKNQSSCFTPIKPEDFLYYYDTYPTNNEWDFSEETMDSTVDNWGNLNEWAENGYIKIQIASSDHGALRIKNNILVAGHQWNKIIVRVKSIDDSDYTFKLCYYNTIYRTTSINDLNWHIIEWDISGLETTGGWIMVGPWDTTIGKSFCIDFVRLVYRDTFSLTVESSYAYCSSINNSLEYYVELDNIPLGYALDFATIALDLTYGNHELTVTPYIDYNRFFDCVFLPGESLTSEYNAKTLYRIYFSYYDSLGIGLPWETFRLEINGSQHMDPWLRDVSSGTILLTRVSDAWNTTLYNNSYTITTDTEISFLIDLYEVTFINERTDREAFLKIKRNDIIVNFTVPQESQVTRRFTAGDYNVSFYWNDTSTNELTFHGSKSLSLTTELTSLGGQIVDCSPPAKEKPWWLYDIVWGITPLMIAVSAVVGCIVATIGYMWRTRIVEPVDANVQQKGLKRSIQDPIVNSTSRGLILMGGEEEKRRRAEKRADARRQ